MITVSMFTNFLTNYCMPTQIFNANISASFKFEKGTAV